MILLAKFCSNSRQLYYDWSTGSQIPSFYDTSKIEKLPIDVNDLLNSGRRVVFTLYVYNCRPGLDCSLTSITLTFF